MTDNDNNDSGQRSRECLDLLRSLREGISEALSALAANDLPRFEASVAAQERLCESVRGLVQSTGAKPASLPAAARELQQHNRIYLGALIRAARTCSALLSLYQDPPRGYSPNARDASTSHTWSCEV